MKYITKNKLARTNYFNKEWKKVYVALTRAKKELVLALDHELLSDSDMAVMRDSIGALGFVYHD
jgi:ATP-dependent exoDNAse (exonuclease V) beta subunit